MDTLYLSNYIKGRQPTAHGSDAARQGILPGPRSFFFFNDGYAAINSQNHSHLEKTFFFGVRHHFGQKRYEFLAKTFLFWSAGMVAARWNMVRTGCCPLVQKVADP